MNYIFECSINLFYETTHLWVVNTHEKQFNKQFNFLIEFNIQ